jgi:hypothetical protein
MSEIPRAGSGGARRSRREGTTGREKAAMSEIPRAGSGGARRSRREGTAGREKADCSRLSLVQMLRCCSCRTQRMGAPSRAVALRRGDRRPGLLQGRGRARSWRTAVARGRPNRGDGCGCLAQPLHHPLLLCYWRDEPWSRAGIEGTEGERETVIGGNGRRRAGTSGR